MSNRFFIILASICIVAAAITVFLLFDTPTEKSGETTYYAVMLEGNKIGYMSQTSTQNDDTIATKTVLSLTMQAGERSVTGFFSSTTFETHDGRPIGFEHHNDLHAHRRR